MLSLRRSGGPVEKFPLRPHGRTPCGPPRPPSPRYRRTASSGIFTVKLFVDVLRKGSIAYGANYAEKRVWKLLQDDPQISQCARAEYPIFYCIPKQFNKVFFVNHQVNAVVLAVFILAKSQRFPGAPVHCEEIPFDSTFVVIVQLTLANSSTFNRVHLGHVRSHQLRRLLESSRFY